MSNIVSNQDLEFVREYYSQRRSIDGQDMTIYQIWENGGALNDSVTPSTYSPAYRSHATLKMLSLLPERGRVFSIGCGNAFVEAEVAKFDHYVRAIDYNTEAVNLARSKQIDAVECDFFDLPEKALSEFDVVYADGLLGHLFHRDEELSAFVKKLKDLTLKPSAWLMFSNDAPREPDVSFSPHDRLRDFWFLSTSYLSKVFTESGFSTFEAYYFPYFRPLSGLRNRSICIAKLNPTDSSRRGSQ